MIKIVFLYAEMVPSWLPTFEVLIEKYQAQVHVVYWDKKKKTPYVPEPTPGLYFYPRSSFSLRSLTAFLDDIAPVAIFVSGWMDIDYLKAARRQLVRGVPVISGFDDWWKKTLRQRVAGVLLPLVRRHFISHAWIAGARQYEYVKRLGFSDIEIIYNLLSCDIELFEREVSNPLVGDQRDRTFIYVGRFSPEKGISCLLDGFKKYRSRYKGTWDLVCIGNGPLISDLLVVDGVKVKDFMTARQVADQFSRAGAFVLASLRDYAPLVVHEAAASGLPMILSSNVGNLGTFGIHNYNCMVFDSGNADQLANALLRFEKLSLAKQREMGQHSRLLAQRITPQICASSLMSVVRDLQEMPT